MTPGVTGASQRCCVSITRTVPLEARITIELVDAPASVTCCQYTICANEVKRKTQCLACTPQAWRAHLLQSSARLAEEGHR